MQCPATLARALTGSASIAGLIITAVIRTMVARAIITAMDLIRTTATTRAGRILIGLRNFLGVSIRVLRRLSVRRLQQLLFLLHANLRLQRIIGCRRSTTPRSTRLLPRCSRWSHWTKDPWRHRGFRKQKWSGGGWED